MVSTIRVPRPPAIPRKSDAVPDLSPPETAAADTIAGDLLEGADAIAKFLFGPTAEARRGHTATGQGLPHFKIGNRLFARKSAIVEWIRAQEKRKACL